MQVQNLPRNYLPDLESARTLVAGGKFEAVDLLFDSAPDTLSQLVRTAFIVVDFSAIEARVIAWLAGEQWRLDLFRAGGNIYCQSASQVFGVPVEKHGINADLRQKGKISELACRSGGSVGALTAMGALDMGLTEAELEPFVDAWRDANPNIVGLWYDIEEAALTAIRTRTKTKHRGLTFSAELGIMFIALPSGRRLTCVLRALDHAGHKIAMHVHDEAVIDEPYNSGATVESVCKLMATPPAWARGLPLDADGYECVFYMKD